MKLVHNIAIVALTVAASTAVFADDAVSNSADTFSIKTATVSYADLDLAVPADAAALLVRIQKTAMKVCRRPDGGTSVDRMGAVRQCFRDSYANGIAAINTKKNLDIKAVAARATTGRNVVTAD